MSKTPYEEECDEIVEYRYQKQQFPNLGGLPIANVCATATDHPALQAYLSKMIMCKTAQSF
jgi:hypothetical protein